MQTLQMEQVKFKGIKTKVSARLSKQSLKQENQNKTKSKNIVQFKTLENSRREGQH